MKTNIELARECGAESMTNPFAIKQIIDERNAALDMVRTVETLNAELEEKIEALQLVVNNLTKHDEPDRLDNLKASNAIEMTKEISVLQAEIAALRKDADLLPMAIMHLAEWANAVQVNGSGWDDWDEHYKDAAYRPGPLRELIDKAMAELVPPANQTKENQ